MKKYYYCYVILFDDRTFYIGRRSSDLPPMQDNEYVGSPQTHRKKWDEVPYRKRILSIHENWEKMCAHECLLLDKVGWKNNHRCLNANRAGVVKEEVLVLARDKARESIKDKWRNDPEWAKERKAQLLQAGAKGRETLKREGYPHLAEARKKGLSSLREAGYPNLRKGVATSAENRRGNPLAGGSGRIRQKQLREEDPVYREKWLNRQRELQRKMVRANKGKIWVNNGYRNKRHDPNTPIPDGWVKGLLRGINK